MANYTYSEDLDTMVSQVNASDSVLVQSKRDKCLAILCVTASYDRSGTAKKINAKEFAKDLDNVTAKEIGYALKILAHYGVTKRKGRGFEMDTDSVYSAIAAIVAKHDKAITGIHDELFGKAETWTLAAACETLVKAARKRDISDDEVLAIIRQTLEAGE
jgi:repressor of nif and glnA expression